jgi:hypothetical protein
MFKTNIDIRISFTAVVLAAAIASASAVLEIGIINGTQAQVTPSSPTSPSPTNKTVSPELKSKICDPNNPKLRFVNTTESNICGIPKTIKNVTTTTSITPTPSPTLTPKPITPPSSPNPITPTPSETTPTPQEPIPGLP